ncbi:unnamed protein product, partial [Amoebophrya sp. A25]
TPVLFGILAFGNNTDGQCGVGAGHDVLKEEDVVHADPHVQRSSLRVLWDPHPVAELASTCAFLAVGADHCLG